MQRANINLNARSDQVVHVPVSM